PWFPGRALKRGTRSRQQLSRRSSGQERTAERYLAPPLCLAVVGGCADLAAEIAENPWDPVVKAGFGVVYERDFCRRKIVMRQKIEMAVLVAALIVGITPCLLVAQDLPAVSLEDQLKAQ